MASKLPPSVEAVWKRKYYVKPDSAVQVVDTPQHLSSFLHMVGIGADPDDTRKPKRVPVDPQSLARTIYEKERAALHPTNTAGAGMGALVFDGAAVIDGVPYLVQACVVSAREARELSAASDHWDSDITGKKGTPRIPSVEWRAWQSYTSFRQRSGQLTSKEIDLRILAQRADEIDEHGSLRAPVLSTFAGARPIPTMPSHAPTPADIASYFRYHIIPLLAVVSNAHPEPSQRTFEIDRKRIPGLAHSEGIRLRLGPDAGSTPQLPEVASATNDSYGALHAGGVNDTDTSVPALLPPTAGAVAPQKDSSAVIRKGELWQPEGQADDVSPAEASESEHSRPREPRKQKLESLVEPLAIRPSTSRSQAGQSVDHHDAGSNNMLGSENARNKDTSGVPGSDLTASEPIDKIAVSSSVPSSSPRISETNDAVAIGTSTEASNGTQLAVPELPNSTEHRSQAVLELWTLVLTNSAFWEKRAKQRQLEMTAAQLLEAEEARLRAIQEFDAAPHWQEQVGMCGPGYGHHDHHDHAASKQLKQRSASSESSGSWETYTNTTVSESELERDIVADDAPPQASVSTAAVTIEPPSILKRIQTAGAGTLARMLPAGLMQRMQSVRSMQPSKAEKLAARRQAEEDYAVAMPEPLHSRPVHDPAALTMELFGLPDEINDEDATVIAAEVQLEPKSTKFGKWLASAQLGPFEIRFHQYGIRDFFDLNFVTESDLNRMTLSYVDKLNLFRAMDTLKATARVDLTKLLQQRTEKLDTLLDSSPPLDPLCAKTTPSKAAVLLMSSSAVLSSQQLEPPGTVPTQPSSDKGGSDFEQLEGITNIDADRAGAQSDADASAVLTSLAASIVERTSVSDPAAGFTDTLELCGLAHCNAKLSTSGVLTVKQLQEAAKRNDSWLMMHGCLTPFESRKLRRMLHVSLAPAAVVVVPKHALDIVDEIDVPSLEALPDEYVLADAGGIAAAMERAQLFAPMWEPCDGQQRSTGRASNSGVSQAGRSDELSLGPRRSTLRSMQSGLHAATALGSARSQRSFPGSVPFLVRTPRSAALTAAESPQSNTGEAKSGTDGGIVPDPDALFILAQSDPLLAGLLSSLGFLESWAALSRVGVTCANDLHTITDDDLTLAGFTRKQRLDFRQGLKTITAGRAAREAHRLGLLLPSGFMHRVAAHPAMKWLAATRAGRALGHAATRTSQSKLVRGCCACKDASCAHLSACSAAASQLCTACSASCAAKCAACLESQACTNMRDEWNESRIGMRVNAAASALRDRLRELQQRIIGDDAHKPKPSLRQPTTCRGRCWAQIGSCCSFLVACGRRCWRPPAVVAHREHFSCRLRFHSFLRLATPGLKPFFGRIVFYCRAVAWLFCFFAFLSLVFAKGTLAVRGEEPLHVTFVIDPSITFGFAIALLNCLWLAIVYFFYFKVYKGHWHSHRHAHGFEVGMEVILFVLTIIAVSELVKVAFAYNLMPSFKRNILGAAACLAISLFPRFPSLLLLGLSGHWTVLGPPIETYNIESLPQVRPPPRITTGGSAMPGSVLSHDTFAAT